MNRIISRSIVIATLLLTGSLYADEASTTPEKPPAWESAATLGLTLTRGNSDTVLFAANVETKKKLPNNEFAFGADATYGEDNGVKNNEAFHGYGQYNHLFTERFFGLVRLDALHDAIADIEYRVSLSPGVGYYFIKEKMTTLALEAGPGVVFEKQGSTEETYATLRLAERFEHKFSDKARVWQSVEFLPQLDVFKNYVVNFEVGAEAALNSKLSLRVVLQDTYDNDPAAGRKPNDVKLISGVTYKF